jgi:formylglycine-generating enzyme required for sulfatase activity
LKYPVVLSITFGFLLGIGNHLFVIGTPPAEKGRRSSRAITNSLGMKLQLIPAGQFSMGSPGGTQSRVHWEFQHTVELTIAFYMGVFEVTQEQYQQVMGRNPSKFAADRFGQLYRDLNSKQLPVESVSWDDAMEFCKRLTEKSEEKKAGRRYRLPTEAEWEYASRGGVAVSAPYSVAQKPCFSLSARQANIGVSSSEKQAGEKGLHRPTAVGSYLPNGFGLYDMHGNVSEWCADWYSDGYYQVSPKQNPQGPKQGELKVARGGSFLYQSKMCRSSARYCEPPERVSLDMGFRVVCLLQDGGE